jgi:spore coat-associated protein N
MSTVTARRLNLGAVALALGVAAWLTVQLSIAAFTATIDNPGNLFAAGDVRLSDSRSGSALFSAEGITPGYEESAAITVTNESTVDTEVALFVGALADDGLAGYLTVVVTRDGAPLYSGKLDALPSSFDAATVADEGPGDETVYVFTVSFPEGQAGVNDAQGKTATATFTWEARSTS